MNSENTPELTVQAMMALRHETEALRIITERLKVKEMGPADHIRTKHEVKAFVETGEISLAESVLKRAPERRDLARQLSQKVRQRRDQRMDL